MSQGNTITLYVFVTSDTPDLYINTIGYCLDHYDIKKVIFLGIVEDRGQRERVKSSLVTIKERVTQQLKLLQEGEYLYREQSTGQWKTKNIEIENYNKRRYARIAEQTIDAQVITYDILDTTLAGFISNNDAVFDLSGVLKTFLIDVYTLLLVNGINNVFVFELKLPKRTFDERELIHNLSLDRRDYEYVNVAKSRYTNGTLIKSRQEETSDKAEIISSSELLENLADRFAKSILLLYGVLVIGVIVWSYVFISQEKWDQLEPVAFVLLTLLPYLISIVVAVFGKRNFSLNPILLYNWLKSYRLNSLKRSAFKR